MLFTKFVTWYMVSGCYYLEKCIGILRLFYDSMISWVRSDFVLFIFVVKSGVVFYFINFIYLYLKVK